MKSSKVFLINISTIKQNHRIKNLIHFSKIIQNSKFYLKVCMQMYKKNKFKINNFSKLMNRIKMKYLINLKKNLCLKSSLMKFQIKILKMR